MVTSYYIAKMSKKSKSMDIGEYYSSLHIPSLKNSFDKNLTCRICLKIGVLPIYGVENSSDIKEALQIFGNIDIHEGDEYPKYLCNICNKFIKSAILFRKIAKQADDVLKQPLKEEMFDHFHDSQDSEELGINTLGPSPVHKKNNKVILNSSNKDKQKTCAKVQCYVCNKIVNKSYYKEHITMHDPNHQKYVCDVCGKSFRLRCAYHNHSLRHRSDFPFKCQYCPYKGRYAELLKNHMRTHTGDYRYMCTECPARFLFKSNLNSHVLLKHKEPQHKCDTCKRSFHTQLTLQRHYEADHLGIKNHVCNLCGKAFGYRNAMMKHQRHVHKREKLMFSRMPSYLQAENKTIETDTI